MDAWALFDDLRAAGSPDEAMYLRIARRVRGAVSSGQLAGGERLPTIRALASAIGVNRDTVSQAYEVLSAEGVVQSVVGRGSFVRAAESTPAASPPPFSPTVERLLEFERARPGFEGASGAIPLHSLVPDPALYPVEEFRKALNRVLATAGPELLAYGGHKGNYLLRESIAAHLGGHGLRTTPEDIVLCQGASQGISLALQLYAATGDFVAVEEPTYHNVLGVLLALGLRPVPVPMNDDGPDLDVLDRVLARPDVKLFYTMPSFHNPVGTCTGAAHRRRLLAIAARHAKPVIEDAFEMDLRFDAKPVPPLAALDDHGLVVHLFSFSKSLFPGIRVGAITASGRAVDALMALKYTNDLSGALVLQAAMAEFVRTGGYRRHLRTLRGCLKTRRDAALEALERHMPPGAHWTRPDGGYQIWVTLASGTDTRAMLEPAAARGVLYSPGYQFNHDGRPSSSLRLTTALADAPDIARGIGIIGALAGETLQRVRRSGSRDGTVHV